MGVETLPARTWVRSYDSVTAALSKRVCYGLYDGERLEPYRRAGGDVPVLFAIPPMSDDFSPDELRQMRLYRGAHGTSTSCAGAAACTTSPPI